MISTMANSGRVGKRLVANLRLQSFEFMQEFSSRRLVCRVAPDIVQSERVSHQIKQLPLDRVCWAVGSRLVKRVVVVADEFVGAVRTP